VGPVVGQPSVLAWRRYRQPRGLFGETLVTVRSTRYDHYMESTSTYRKSGTVGKAFALLRALGDADHPLSLSELAASIQAPLPTAHRLMRTLADEGFAYRNTSTKAWALGIRTVELANSFKREQACYAAALPKMRELASRYNETVSLVCPDGNDAVRIESVKPPAREEMWYSARVGARAPIYAGAGRKVLLAYYPKDELSRVLAPETLAQITPNTIVDTANLRSELDLIRRQGFATSDGEQSEGAVSVAVALRPFSDKPLASIGVTGPSFRFTPDRAREIGPDLVEDAEEICQVMRR